ncbi:ead/Ea22-like family protein [Enterobacter kobei]|uniref:ead/Ea22-like family protein n=1 Tax=Enterobacter kobei TaxID=208224 RepID=UPI003EDAFC6B
MSNIDKRALREAAEKALAAMKRLLMMPNNELFDEALLNVDGDVDAANAFNLLTGPETVLALLDELEAAEERYEDMLRQARSFREAHDSASEIIRKLERNKPVVNLPTTKLWAGKVACYEASEIIELLSSSGIRIQDED